MCRVECTSLTFLLACCLVSAGEPAGSAGPAPEDARREAAIAEFTRKMKEANYPALFDNAAEEFNVPADVLKGIAFAETRWDHLIWPPGETVSPDTGMPRPYGIMSLWDNSFFGHSLLEAAQLIGQEPETLKTDALEIYVARRHCCANSTMKRQSRPERLKLRWRVGVTPSANIAVSPSRSLMPVTPWISTPS
jgi:hypothetical protein